MMDITKKPGRTSEQLQTSVTTVHDQEQKTRQDSPWRTWLQNVSMTDEIVYWRTSSSHEGSRHLCSCLFGLWLRLIEFWQKMSGRLSLNYRSFRETAIILIRPTAFPPPLFVTCALAPSSTLSGSTLVSSLNFQYLFVNDAVPLLHFPPVFSPLSSHSIIIQSFWPISISPNHIHLPPLIASSPLSISPFVLCLPLPITFLSVLQFVPFFPPLHLTAPAVFLSLFTTGAAVFSSRPGHFRIWWIVLSVDECDKRRGDE